MSLSEIKRKYRQILEESRDGSGSSDDDDRVVTLYEQMQSVPDLPSQKKKCILTTSNTTSFNKENYKPTPFGEKEILALRERLAQAI